MTNSEMTMTSFFSIVIPTRNRSQLIGYAIKSVLNQSLQDFEIVVADSDDSGATENVIASFHDPRVRRFSTGQISMADNWEFGRRQARGEYLMFLEDKQALMPRALERIHEAVESERHPVVTWLVDLFYDVGSEYRYAGIYRNATKSSRLVKTDEVVKLFLESSRSKSKVLLPRGFNSCCHRSLIEKIVKGPAQRLNLPVAPDYTMAFLQLAYSDHQLHIDEALVVSGIRESNGLDFVRKAKAAKVFIEEAGGEKVFVDKVPIKSLLTNNLVYNDFLRIRDLVGGNLSKFDLDLVNYFVQCYEDIAEARGKYGVDMLPEETAWKETLRSEDATIQARVKIAVDPIREELGRRLSRARRSQIKNQARVIGRRLGLNKLKRSTRPKQQGSSSQTFPDILSAIEWEQGNLNRRA